MADMQPIIRGVQAVGKVQLLYKYLKPDSSGEAFELPIPDSFTFGDLAKGSSIAIPDAGIPVAGFRLDSEFIRANPQIASSFVIPLLGGGGIALTNNNRTGVLNIVCAKVAVPNLDASSGAGAVKLKPATASQAGVFGDTTTTGYYDMVTLAQLQQAQDGGDSYGANITLGFEFAGIETSLTFHMCTIATVDPVGVAGNDAVNYAIAINYLNWTSQVKNNNA